jgi:hypothetical protein
MFENISIKYSILDRAYITDAYLCRQANRIQDYFRWRDW